MTFIHRDRRLDLGKFLSNYHTYMLHDPFGVMASFSVSQSLEKSQSEVTS
jgi:hypothetical protein